jgi:hypothetical protein
MPVGKAGGGVGATSFAHAATQGHVNALFAPPRHSAAAAAAAAASSAAAALVPMELEAADGDAAGAGAGAGGAIGGLNSPLALGVLRAGLTAAAAEAPRASAASFPFPADSQPPSSYALQRPPAAARSRAHRAPSTEEPFLLRSAALSRGGAGAGGGAAAGDGSGGVSPRVSPPPPSSQAPPAAAAPRQQRSMKFFCDVIRPVR